VSEVLFVMWADLVVDIIYRMSEKIAAIMLVMVIGMSLMIVLFQKQGQGFLFNFSLR
jgi:hypothetical protein